MVVVYHLQDDTEDTPPPAPTTTRNKQTNNDVNNYTQTLPEDATSTVPILANKQNTDPSYIIQD